MKSLKMYTVVRAIRLLGILLLTGYVSCQDGFSEQDLLRLHQLSSSDGQYETITSYSTNVVNRDPSKNEHSVSAVSVQYHITDEPDKIEDVNRVGHGRSEGRRKIFHIKNPFQRNLEQNMDREPEAFSSQDNDGGASNQYPSMQYSLPPEDFLQQMRAESQYLQQFSTPAPQPSYTATPQSQYQYSNQGAYEGTQASNHIESKLPQAQAYHGNPSGYQYNLAQPNSFLSEGGQSTPNNQSPTQYVSTSIPSSQYVATPANTQSYVSSSSPLYLSSQPSVQQYVSSPVTVYQTGSPDYNSRVTTSSNSINYDMNESNKKLQIDHYDNGANGIRYPINFSQQYQNENPSTTQSPPSSTPYPDQMRDAWQNVINAGVNSLSKSIQEASLYAQYQNNEQQQQQQGRQESNSDSINSETHRIGNVAAANNMYMNFVQPDYQVYSNVKSRTRDLEQEIGQPETYSHGDYGWKLAGKKSLVDSYGSSYSPYSRHQVMSLQPENQQGQASYQTEPLKQLPNYSYNPQRITSELISQSSKLAEQEAQDFAKAAAKAQENMKQQQLSARLNEHYYFNNYAPSYSSNNGLSNLNGQSNVVSTFYGNTDKHKTKYLSDNTNANNYLYGGNTDVITGSPYLYASSRDIDVKTKQPFDHAKALKNIVPIDVTNVLPNNEGALKSIENTRYSSQNYPKEQIEQSLKQAYRPLTDSYYKDKNTGYGFNIKTKPEDTIGDGVKQLEQHIAYYNKHNSQEPSYNQGVFSDAKRYGESSPQQVSYAPQITNTYNENLQPPNNIQQSIQRPLQQDIGSILKLSDIPYRFTQGLTSDALKLHNTNFDHNSIPQQLPTRINQNVGSHSLDVTNSLLNKILLSKQAGLNFNRPNDIDPQTGGPLSTIHGFRVANPFNVDLKLVAEMLKGKPAVDETLREQFNKPLPLKLDMSTLHQLLIKNDGYGNLASLSDGISAIGNPYADPFGSRYPYQGQVKYSRSQEEEETILPIAESSNTHPIGAVMEQDESPNGRDVDGDTDLTAHEDVATHNSFEDRPKSMYNIRDRRPVGPRHPNSLIQGRHSFHRKYPKHDVQEPYPLLKPPPQYQSRSRISHSRGERRGRRRRIAKPKITKLIKTEPLFEAESNPIQTEVESPMPILLRPPPPVAEDKSDVIEEKKDN